jgi:hypothetical protein
VVLANSLCYFLPPDDEVTGKRMPYTRDGPRELTKIAQLGGVIGDDIYFYAFEYQALWRVDARIGNCEAKYNALFNSAKRSMEQVWVEGRP